MEKRKVKLDKKRAEALEQIVEATNQEEEGADKPV